MVSIGVDKTMHEELFSRCSLKLGKIHWYILKADSEMERRRYKDTEDTDQKAITDFGKEVGSDEMYWWVFKKEDRIDELKNRTQQVLNSVQELKNASLKLHSNPPSQYNKLISTLKGFSESYATQIDTLYNYIVWLHERDILAPSILFTYKVWGTTRRSDRYIKIEADSFEAEAKEFQEVVTEIVFGLRKGRAYGLKYTLSYVHHEISDEIYQRIDFQEPEQGGPVRVSISRVYSQTSYEVLSEFAAFFEFIRNSLRNVLLDIEKCEEQKDLMKSESFWSKFIAKAKNENKTEEQLWDFKETLEMWHVKKADIKAKKELKFCETLACLANAKGGALIIGIADTPPRKIQGVGDTLVEIERRLKDTRTVIANYIKYDRDIVYFKQVIVKDELDNEKICLVIAIAQTESVVAVKDKQGRFSYPIRRSTGMDRVDRDELAMEKLNIKHDNYDFMRELKQFIYDK